MALELKDIQKSYREPDGTELPVLNVEHFLLGDTEQMALVGASGGGKTTLLNVISGISSPDRGSVTLDGTNVTRMPEPMRDRFRAERIGFVFQTFNLLQAFSALENVLLGMSFSGRKVSRTRAKELLEHVGLGGRLGHKPAQLSIGEQQRVAVARALANKPSLLLADEPTASIDVANQENILNLIRKSCEEEKVALLLVTHNLDIAQQFGRVEQLAEFNKVGGQS